MFTMSFMITLSPTPVFVNRFYFTGVRLVVYLEAFVFHLGNTIMRQQNRPSSGEQEQRSLWYSFSYVLLGKDFEHKQLEKHCHFFFFDMKRLELTFIAEAVVDSETIQIDAVVLSENSFSKLESQSKKSTGHIIS